MPDQASAAAEQASFFLTVAAIAATLFGLTLVALASFLPELMKHFEGAALAAFPEQDRHERTLPRWRPYSLNDLELLDGDPLVIFISYSVGVSWNVFGLPLAIGLTAAWTKAPLGICGIEMLAFLILMYISFEGRQASIGKLKVYLTREEPYWPVLTRIAMASLAAATLLVAIASFTSDLRTAQWLPICLRPHVPNSALIVRTLRIVSIVALLLGTYILNKEVFIYFKALTIDKMRASWVARFVEEYKKLSEDVTHVLSSLKSDSKLRAQLLQTWNDGMPAALSSRHDKLRDEGYAAHREHLWKDLLRGRRGTPGWMLDVPKIASWESEVKNELASCLAEIKNPQTAR